MQGDLGQSQFWIDRQVEKITREFPEGKIVVSSGISPSAHYHIGHFREILTADALTWGLRGAGREVVHKHVVDNMDPMRERYDFLPEEYENYINWPICLIPSPQGAGSYADYFYDSFEKSIQAMEITPDIVIRSYEDLYQNGLMAAQIEKVLENLSTIKSILASFDRELPQDWTPVQVKGEDNRFANARPGTWDRQAQTIEGVSYVDGGAKLNWRLDWPARWQVLGVDVEPYSIQEHGAAGGSYDTGVAFSRQVFGAEPMLPAGRYGDIHMRGDTKKMSASKGNHITPEQALTITPPSLLRYFIVRSRPDKQLEFDPGEKLMALYDEYKEVQAAVQRAGDHQFQDACRFADIGDRLTSVPFNHLVSVYQAGRGEVSRVRELLEGDGYQVDRYALESELYYVANWLEMYAPAHLRFELQEELPEVKLGSNQVVFLANLARFMEEATGDPETIHARIHELKDAHNLSARDAFQAIYLVLLGQTSGPKAGWYVTTIDRDWLTSRLRLET
jgi:lysyl-tRNA synthetase class 1